MCDDGGSGRANFLPHAPLNQDVGLVHMPTRGHGALAQIETLQQQGRIQNNSTTGRRVINADAAFVHYFFKVP